MQTWELCKKSMATPDCHSADPEHAQRFFKILIKKKRKIVLTTTATYAQGEFTCLPQNIFILS